MLEPYNHWVWLLTKPLRLRSIIAIGLIARVLFALGSDHVYFPDEIFQTIEQAYRLITGYGVVPWEFAYHMRSYVPALLLTGPLKLLLELTRDPYWYTLGMRIFLACVSVILIPASHALTYALYRNRTLALLAAFSSAIWYELIYFSTRAFTEAMALNFLAGAVLVYLTKHRERFVLAGLLVGMGILIRIMYLPLGIYIVYVLSRRLNRMGMNRFVLGLVLATLLFGVVDMVAYGSFLVHIPLYFKYSVTNGLSRIFGEQPWWYYLYALTVTSGGLIVSIFSSQTRTHAKSILIALLLIVVPHSLIQHKEYRFVLIVIPMVLILASSWLYNRTMTWSRLPLLTTSIIMLLVSIAGALRFLPISQLYPYAFGAENDLAFYREAAKGAVCGMWDKSGSWVEHGSNYLIGARVPLYSLDAPPTPTDYDVIVRHGIDTYAIERMSTPCIAQKPPYFRSFDLVEDMLTQ